MDSRLSRTATTILVAALIMGVMPLVEAAPPPAPAFWITPETLSFDTDNNRVGDRFNVTIWVNTMNLSYAWQAQVVFNVSQVNAVRADYTGEGKSMFFTGHGTVAVSPTIDNETGFVMHGESLIGMDKVPASSGSLFWVEFMIMTAPTGEETLTSLVSVDSNPDTTFILDSDSNSVPGVSMGSANYTLSYSPPVRDVAVTDLSFSSYRPKQGVDNVTITVIVLNNGTIPETFDVTIAFDSTTIATLNVFELETENNATLTYEWNTSAAEVGPHNMTASTSAVPSDTNATNNEKSRSLTVLSPTGPNTDLNGDGRVDMVDIAMVAYAFGTHEGDPRWNQLADINGDGRIDMVDVAHVAKDFGKT